MEGQLSIRNKLARPYSLLALLMLIAYGLRLLLIVNGGQLYHPDELRYYRSVEAAKHIFNGDFKNAIKTLLKYEFHQGIAVAKLVPALFHRFIHNLNHDDNLLWKDLWHTPPQNFRLPALIFALPSVICVGMLYLIQRQAGANDAEALLSAFLLAASQSFFFFAKHLLPYDIAILIGLIAIYAAFRLHARRLINALFVGWLAFLVFWIYNGYVTLAITIGILYCVLLAADMRDALRRALGMATGALLFFLPIVAFNRVFLEENVILQMMTFSETVNHGAFSEGAIFPFLYFRDVEGAMSIVWIVGLALAAWRIPSQRPSSDRRRAWLWFACLLSLYLTMSVLSTGLQLFVVYGRVVRSLVPFIAMVCAYAFAPRLLRHGPGVLVTFVVGVGTLSIANFVPAITQQYPLEVAWDVYQIYDDVSFETSVETSENSVFSWWDLQPQLPDARYRLFNAGNYFPISDIRSNLPEGEVLIEISHPLNYRPWQYEGLTPEMRDLVNRSDFEIWLIDTEPDAE